MRNKCVFCVCFCYVICMSLSLDPPYNFFFTKLVFVWFFEIKLENGLSHVWKRREKVGKG